ncbi:MAG: ATP cone domain-containing protein [Nanoarchaeota archaeon]
MVIYVTKASGEKEVFDPRKIKRTLLRAGAKSVVADGIVNRISKQVRDGMSTRQLLDRVLLMLKQEPQVASRYDLKAALMRLGPTGFMFEKFVARLLKEYGYETRTNLMLKGRCVKHEVDVVAKNKEVSVFIECKYHNESGIYTNLHVAMYTWARFVDLQDGAAKGLCERFDQGWLVTNTRFSQDAAEFGVCRGLRLIGWHFPKQGNLQWLIESKKLWPVTVLGVEKFILEQLVASHLLLVKDIALLSADDVAKKAKIQFSKAQRLVRDAQVLI